MPTTRSQTGSLPSWRSRPEKAPAAKPNRIAKSKPKDKLKTGTRRVLDEGSAGPSRQPAIYARPPISSSHFGLIQERHSHSLYALVIQAILWNQTGGKAARPVLDKILELYPDPRALSQANLAELTDILYPIGLHNQRAKRLIKLAQVWLDAPPRKERRYVRRDYPDKGDGRDAKVGEALEEKDEREGWEIAHLPGVGPYALDSYRMFYRDTLRGVGDEEGFEPEWKRVAAEDKDLKAYLAWRWECEGYRWDLNKRKVTGRINEVEELENN